MKKVILSQLGRQSKKKKLWSFFDTLFGYIPKDSGLVGLKWKLYICILKMSHLRAIALRMIGRNEAILIVFIVSRIYYEGWYFFFLLHLVASRQKMFTHCLFSAPDYWLNVWVRAKKIATSTLSRGIILLHYNVFQNWVAHFPHNFPSYGSKLSNLKPEWEGIHIS